MVLLIICLGECLASPAYGAEKADNETPRQTLLLDKGWKFFFGQMADDVVTPEFDDSAWDSVDVPHTWNRVGYYLDEESDHLHRPDNVDERLGTGWYRLAFAPPAMATQRRAWLEFDAASRTAEVWLNGIRLGEHRGGFTRFRFDATAALKTGRRNLLVVKTDNTKPAPESPTADVLPISGDFFVHGGLYRPVRLVVTDAIHIDMLDFGGPGVYARTTRVDDGMAEIAVKSYLRNDDDDTVHIDLRASLIDHAGVAVATQGGRMELPPGEKTGISRVLRVDKPIVWHGVENPYLYALRVELRSPDATLLDRLDQQYGIRRIEIDPESGLQLNGKPYRLRGVAYHQDREGKGWAVSTTDISEDVQLMLDMGVNTIRLAHYPHGQPIHDLADRHGLVLWDEIPLMTSWGYDGEDRKNVALAANATLQLQEMIRQNFNHPSVAVWGIANELDFAAVIPAFLGKDTAGITSPMPLLEELAALAKEEDPSRRSTLANCCEGRAGLDNVAIPPTALATESVGVNRYFGWYYGEPGDLGPHLDTLHAARPRQPMAVSEYGAGGAVSIHTDDPLGGPVDAAGRNQPEEYMSLVHESNWQTISAKPYLWGSWVWNGFDFATTIRREGDAIDINTKGLVTYDRRVRKDSYYFYKSNWSEAPTVRIAGRRYRDRAYPTTDVRIYSNANETELQVNGDSLGKKSGCRQNVCVWSNVELSAGINSISAYGAFDSGSRADTVKWRLDPSLQHAYHIDAGALVAARSDAITYGSDHFFFGGKASSVDTPGGWGRPADLAVIADTDNRDLAATYREGDFRYRLPVENGDYEVILVFVEPAEPPGNRRFDVLANGEPMLEGFDIAAVARGRLTEVTRRFDVAVTGGELELAFRPVRGSAVVSAISIDPLAP